MRHAHASVWQGSTAEFAICAGNCEQKSSVKVAQVEMTRRGMPRNLSDVEGGDRHVVYLLYDVARMKQTLPCSLGSGSAGAEAKQGERRAIRQDSSDTSVRHGLPVLNTPVCLHWSLNPEQQTTAINIGCPYNHVLFPFDVV